MSSSVSRRTLLLSCGAGGVSLVCPQAISAATASVNLLCVTKDGGLSSERHFALNFAPGSRRWSESEPGGTRDVLVTKSGDFVTVANTTSLRKDAAAKTVVAVLRNFNPSSASPGESGNDGKAVETGRVFEWKVDLVVP